MTGAIPNLAKERTARAEAIPIHERATMKTLHRFVALLVLAAAQFLTVAWAQTGPRTLVLYDAPPGNAYSKLGYGYAIIGDVGPSAFYEKTVGAMPIPNSAPGVYAGMLDVN